MYKEIFDAVESINEKIGDACDCEIQHIYLETDGKTFIVKFLDCVIFNSDDDDRDYNESTDEYILTIEQHLIQEVKDRISMVKSISKYFK